MSHPPRTPGPESTFASLYDAIYADLLRFVQRRVHHTHAEDVVAEAFLVVWRRLDELPHRHEDARAWVFGIARNLLLNARRGDQRRRALDVHLAQIAPTPSISPTEDPHVDLVVSRVDLARAWTLLSAVHQEALALTAFDHLSATEAAQVIDISPVAYRLRLSRARRALRARLQHQPPTTTATRLTPERTNSDAS